MKKSFFYSWFFILGLLVSCSVWAGAWQTASYNHFSKDEALDDVLGDFSSVVGVPVTISNRVKANTGLKVNGNFKNLTAVQFLNRLSGLYQLTWYFDSSAVYIYQNDEVKSELLHFDNTEISAIKRMLINLRVWDSRFSWKTVSDRNLLFVSGPPRYIQLIKEVAGLVDKNNDKKNNDKYEVRVFELKYAWADDREVAFREKTTVIPGIATTIKNILAGGGKIKLDVKSPKNPKKTDNTAFPITPVPPVSTASGSTLDRLQTELTKQNNPVSVEASEDNTTDQQEVSAPAYIQANVQRNAVVVYDLSSRMPLYEQLISALDVPTEQVEIEVSIVDINTDHLSELGLDWKSVGKHIEFSFGDVSSLTSSGALSSTNYLISRLNLLQSNGNGQFVSKPSVITLNNVQAIIDNSTTFYAKLQGERAVDLVPINAGSVLKVTPRIIRDNNKRLISLDVNIEDGQVSTDNAARTDGLPQVSNSTVTTQAVVGENNSLLIGGYYRDVSKKTRDSIPILGSIPVIKYLFSDESTSRSKVARLFMITPRIVENINAESAANKIYDDLVTTEAFDTKNTHYQTPSFHWLDNNKKAKESLNIYD